MLGVVGGHIIGLLLPKGWTDAIGISEETYHAFALGGGLVAGAMTFVGLVMLIYRRRTVRPVFKATTPMDKVMYLFLAGVILLGCWNTVASVIFDSHFNYRESVSPVSCIESRSAVGTAAGEGSGTWVAPPAGAWERGCAARGTRALCRVGAVLLCSARPRTARVGVDCVGAPGACRGPLVAERGRATRRWAATARRNHQMARPVTASASTGIRHPMT